MYKTIFLLQKKNIIYFCRFLVFLEEGSTLRLLFGIKSGLNIIALNNRDCFVAFFFEVHFENTLFVFLLMTE